MKLSVIARALRYASKSMKRGDIFETSARDAKTLKAAGLAADADQSAAATAPVARAGKTPAGRGGRMRFPKAPKPDQQEEQQPGLYGRRDMRAED